MNKLNAYALSKKCHCLCLTNYCQLEMEPQFCHIFQLKSVNMEFNVKSPDF